MAKKRGKNPYKADLGIAGDFIDMLLGFGAGAAMHAIGKHEEKKHGKFKYINPYDITAIHFATGGLKYPRSTDLLGFGLLAAGAFDDSNYEQPWDRPRRWTGPDDYIIDEIEDIVSLHGQTNNYYAWRLNCEDGSAYGVYPEDYETRAEYNEALKDAKENGPYDYTEIDECEETFEDNTSDTQVLPEPEFKIICRVSILSSGENKYYALLSQNHLVGEKIIVPVNDIEEEAIIIAIEKYEEGKSPVDYSSLQRI